MLMNAAISSATTVALLGHSLPDWFKDLVILAIFFSLLFSLPTLIRFVYKSIVEVDFNDKK